jgi:four helix bundle protein
MQRFRDLKVWQCSHALTLDIYKATEGFPNREMFGLTSQLRRASSSIPANIAEACGRGGGLEFARFLKIAAGSASELEYHLLLAKDLGFLSSADHQRLSEKAVETRKMLASLISKVQEGRTIRELNVDDYRLNTD